MNKTLFYVGFAIFSQTLIGMETTIHDLPNAFKHTIVNACFYPAKAMPQDIVCYKAMFLIMSYDGQIEHGLKLQQIEKGTGQLGKPSFWREESVNNKTVLMSCASRYFAHRNPNSLGMLVMDPYDLTNNAFIQFERSNVEFFLGQI